MNINYTDWNRIATLSAEVRDLIEEGGVASPLSEETMELISNGAKEKINQELKKRLVE